MRWVWQELNSHEPLAIAFHIVDLFKILHDTFELGWYGSINIYDLPNVWDEKKAGEIFYSNGVLFFHSKDILAV